MTLRSLLLIAAQIFWAVPTMADTVNWSTLNKKQRDGYVTAVVKFKDYPWLVDFAYCESSFEHTNPDGSIKRGEVDEDDIGFMQINLRYHKEDATKMGLNVFGYEDNLDYAIYLAETQGKQPWSASFECRENLRLVNFPKSQDILASIETP